MDSKKRLMFILEDDYYYITLKVLAILKALDCNKKPFEDYRKIGIIFELIKSQSNLLLLEKIISKLQLDIFDSERIIGISCNAKMNSAVIKRVLFFLEKQNIINMNKSSKGDYIDVLLLDSCHINELIEENILDDDIEKVKLLKREIPRLRSIKNSTMCKKIFCTIEVMPWED